MGDGGVYEGLTSEQEDLRATARAFIADVCPPAVTRRLISDLLTQGYDRKLWTRLAAELGLAGPAIPEEYGGSGCGMIELAVVSEELGRALVPVPYLSTVVLAANAVLGDPRLAQRMLPGIADGSLIATVVLDGSLLIRDGRLSGTGEYVIDGHLADVVLVPVGHRLYAVSGDAPGLGRRAHVTLDQSRPLATLVFDDVAAEPYDPPRANIRDLAITALAAEQVGGAQRCLEMATAYARTREQFGRPIGSFQAIKHKLADILLGAESARSAAYHAAWTADQEPERVATAAALAGSYCGEAYLKAAAENIQIHGGIGVTWEHDAHLYFKRATSSARLLGTPSAHRAAIAPQIGL
jgi:alkylation response protein AidB-like acyl-CoA dehydrogenase